MSETKFSQEEAAGKLKELAGHLQEDIRADYLVNILTDNVYWNKIKDPLCDIIEQELRAYETFMAHIGPPKEEEVDQSS